MVSFITFAIMLLAAGNVAADRAGVRTSASLEGDKSGSTTQLLQQPQVVDGVMITRENPPPYFDGDIVATVRTSQHDAEAIVHVDRAPQGRATAPLKGAFERDESKC